MDQGYCGFASGRSPKKSDCIQDDIIIQKGITSMSGIGQMVLGFNPY
jgi:hypothetical protein